MPVASHMNGLSKTEEYALRATIHLARRAEEGPQRSSQIAEAIGLPPNYLSKILHRLARQGLVTSERGRYGGFRLARDPAAISLEEVLAPFRPLHDTAACLLGRPECSDENPCGAHARWKKVQRATAEFFAGTTVADVMNP